MTIAATMASHRCMLRGAKRRHQVLILLVALAICQMRSHHTGAASMRLDDANRVLSITLRGARPGRIAHFAICAPHLRSKGAKKSSTS